MHDSSGIQPKVVPPWAQFAAGTSHMVTNLCMVRTDRQTDNHTHGWMSSGAAVLWLQIRSHSICRDWQMVADSLGDGLCECGVRSRANFADAVDLHPHRVAVLTTEAHLGGLRVGRLDVAQRLPQHLTHR
uniref:Uncharacterized protein n=1 Tax=Vitrella brassicaformis TaxID=1169539 RepID=A0A7S1JME3_9ALVE